MSSIAFSKLNPTCSMLESCLKKSGADFSISCARLSCWTITYVKSPGIMKNGKINTDTGKFRILNINAKTISLAKMKITSITKTLLASVKIDPLSKNSCNLDKYFSGTIVSKNTVKSSIILNFIK
ncbi:hypothetical protein [Methanobrevibacter sp. YE315]|uniref:hypothetical protein n=1 Tax=Methanobrevibacter sp. YE315 TaxID=1609968 RepID=UPI001E46E514|nr:hypothetical protein [Methanobrevibacter sp. YE315]